MREGLRVSITLSGLSRLYPDRLADVLELASAADAAGIDQIAVPDHLAIGPRTDRYPYGRFPLPADEPWLEPLTLLAAMAGATRRIRLAPGVLIAPLRPALLLAKTVATLDVLSGGRVDLGVGLGWQREEFAGAGVPFAGRAERLDDQLRACRALWSGGPVSFHSETDSFDDLICLPRPLQPGGPSLWFGVAPSERNAQRIAEFGAGWLPMASDPEEIARGVVALRARLRARRGAIRRRLGVRANAPLATSAAAKPDLDATLEATAAPARGRASASPASRSRASCARRDELPGFLARLVGLRIATERTQPRSCGAKKWTLSAMRWWSQTPPTRAYSSSSAPAIQAGPAVAHRARREQLPARARPVAVDVDLGIHEVVTREEQSRLRHARADRVAALADAEAGASVPDGILGEERGDLDSASRASSSGGSRSALPVTRVHQLGVARLQPPDRLGVLERAYAGGERRVFVCHARHGIARQELPGPRLGDELVGELRKAIPALRLAGAHQHVVVGEAEGLVSRSGQAFSNRCFGVAGICASARIRMGEVLEHRARNVYESSPPRRAWA